LDSVNAPIPPEAKNVAMLRSILLIINSKTKDLKGQVVFLSYINHPTINDIFIDQALFFGKFRI